MSFLKRALASVGIGSAKVDTILQKSQLMPGENIVGETVVMGGNVAQDVDEIYLDVLCRYKAESGDSTYYTNFNLIHHRLNQRFTLQANERKSIPFTVQLPIWCPLSLGGYPVSLRTGLSIAAAADPGDLDTLHVTPHPIQAKVLQAMERLGFYLYKADCEQNRRMGGMIPFVQEFEFKPSGGMRAAVDEVEIIFNMQAQICRVMVVVDRRARGFSGFLDEWSGYDDRKLSLDFNLADANQPVEWFAGALQNAIQAGIAGHGRSY